jgi:hypothetical protein
MNIIQLPPDHDAAHDDGAFDEREWQAQERALRAERLHLSGDADPAYRRVAAALRAPPPVALPADFARRMALRVGAATLDLRMERWLLLGCCAVLAVAVPGALALYGSSGIEVAAAVFPSLSQAAPGWLLAVLACVALNGLMEPLRRRLAAR